jgi:hypothetical protein
MAILLALLEDGIGTHRKQTILFVQITPIKAAGNRRSPQGSCGPNPTREGLSQSKEFGSLATKAEMLPSPASYLSYSLTT